MTARSALLALLLLAGCGFEPLYDQDSAAPDADLGDVYVNNIAAGRPGQQLRQVLQQRLGNPVSGADSRYQLTIGYGENAQGIAIQPDNSSTFTRVIGTASWTLSTVGLTPRVLATGNARTVDGFDQIDQQYFQATISNETLETRLTANLADEISLQLASWFRRAHEQHPEWLTPRDRVANGA